MYSRWTDKEKDVVNAFLDACDNNPPYGYSKNLAPLLPNRSRQDIRNMVNLGRRHRLHMCPGCSDIITDTQNTRCPKCTEKQRQTRQNHLAQGNCAVCGQTLNVPGASATLCPPCRRRRQSHRPKDLDRFNQSRPPARNRKDPLACHKIVRWPSCGHSRWIAENIAKTQRPAVDIFGGTAEILRLIAALGGRPYAYFDLDPRIVNLVQHAIQQQPLTTEAQTLFGNDKERKRRLRVLGDTLRPLLNTIQHKDAIDVLQHPQLMPENAIFIADPPWPGTNHPCLPRIDHEALMEALLDLPQGQDFILSLGSERTALVSAAKTLGPHARLYWRTSGPFRAKTILAISPGLAFLNPGTRIALNAIGL